MENTRKVSNVILSEEAYRENSLQYREQGRVYLAEMNQYLANKTVESITAFIEMFDREGFYEYYVPCLPELSYAHIFAAITVDEIHQIGGPRFILLGKSIEELTVRLKEIEFLLWEIEFTGNKEAEQKLYQYISAYQISIEALCTIVNMGGMNKALCYTFLTCIFLEHNEIKKAIRILRNGVESYPDCKEMLPMLVQLYEKTGEYALANEYRERMK